MAARAPLTGVARRTAREVRFREFTVPIADELAALMICGIRQPENARTLDPDSPALEEAEETHDITLEAYEEHNLVKQLLAELESEAKDQEQWTAKFTVLKENVEHHVEEEEGELFPKARKVLGKERSEEIGSEIEQAKRQSKAASAKS